ncbi:MAG: DUF4374 domain-containing protein [Bacteroidota bacterium]
MKLKYFILPIICLALLMVACEDDEEVTPTPDPDPEPLVETFYFLGIEAATDPTTDVLSTTTSLTEGTVSPINNGFEQPAWMTFMQGPDQIIVGGYTSAPEFTSYELDNGELVKGSSFFVDLTPYAFDFVDEENLIMVGSPREGLAEKKIYHVNTDNVSIINTVVSDFGNIEADSLLAFPVDVKVRDGKMFIAYYHIHANGSFSTPIADQAHIAIFDYPSLALDKVISDDRAPNIGRYYSTNALEIDEDGNIYAYSPSSLACGYAPVPSKNSGVLRIPSGSTEFDANFYIDFETISGGFKIQDMFYVADGKAVVRVLQEDETNPAFLWATYAPTGETPLLSTGILDLNAQTFTLLDNVPTGGGGWNAAHLVEDTKLYLGVSNSTYAGVYIIDVAAGTATEGVSVDGNYAKGVLSLTGTIEE